MCLVYSRCAVPVARRPCRSHCMAAKQRDGDYGSSFYTKSQLLQFRLFVNAISKKSLIRGDYVEIVYLFYQRFLSRFSNFDKIAVILNVVMSLLNVKYCFATLLRRLGAKGSYLTLVRVADRIL